MIRIRGFARKAGRSTKGGSLPAPTREIRTATGPSNGDAHGNLNTGTRAVINGHSNGNGNGNGNGNDNGNGKGNGAEPSHYQAVTDPSLPNGRTYPNGNHANGNGDHITGLPGMVEDLLDPRPPIEGRPPLNDRSATTFDEVNGMSPLRTTFARATPLDSGKPSPVWKRVFDICCVLLTLPIWLPLLLLVMGWIKLVSPGPLFYRQQRVGYRGRLFMIWKFRTMHVNADTRGHEEYFAHLMDSDSPMTKLDALDDNRLIRCGRLLRASALDELPQVFNVLRGDMSLVGPRPCLPNEFKRYNPAQRERVNAPPGLTGYWQVNGKNKTTFSEMIAMDIFYTENMSIWLDVAIICKTIPALIAEIMEARVLRARRLVVPAVPAPALNGSAQKL
jgi:lipopolysaccharide/colanic/teichoic acid biosynthesis glycosyltransferase